MSDIYVVTGTATDERTLVLDEALPLHQGRVRVSVEPLVEPNATQRQRVLDAIRERQAARGHQPRDASEVDAYLRAERTTWDE